MAGNPLTDPDWAANTTDQVVALVDNVKAKTTKPAVMAARGLVFGILAAFLGLFAIVLLFVGIMRGLQSAIEPVADQERAVYISYFIVGALFSIVGLVLFKMRNDGSTSV